MLDRGKIDCKGFFGAERFTRTVRFDRPIINAATEIVELKTKLSEKIDKIRTGEALQLAAGLHTELFQFSLRLLADSPDLADRQILHEAG